MLQMIDTRNKLQLFYLLINRDFGLCEYDISRGILVSKHDTYGNLILVFDDGYKKANVNVGKHKLL